MSDYPQKGCRKALGAKRILCLVLCGVLLCGGCGGPPPSPSTPEPVESGTVTTTTTAPSSTTTTTTTATTTTGTTTTKTTTTTTATTTTTNTTVRHRIEIVGAGSALSEEVRDAIRSAAPGKEISRIVDGATGQTIFAVGTFPEKADAEKVAEAIKSADGSLSTNIIELGK